MEFQTIRHDVSDGILTITLSRPEQLNAFTVTMAEELQHSFRAVNDDDAIRAVIVTGADRAFCAGMDLRGEGNVFGLDENLTPGLSDMADLDNPAIAAVRDAGGRVTLAIHDCRKPVIAAINGAAVGIGATMTLAMDRRLMSKSARIGLVFGRIGIVPEACSTWYLPRLVGPSAAINLVLGADILDAEAALVMGLVDEVQPDDDLLAQAIRVADSWTRNRSPVAIALTRQMVRRNGSLSHPSDAHRIDSLAMFWTSIGDGKEGVSAFLEKRKPHFRGRASAMPDFYDDWMHGPGPLPGPTTSE
ncbi:crotonase/enoyl-CoA hydratase family protein [Paenarthrobacter sp. CM16]|uniref:crotonase/enoyl-CoA hydratase family protein n=1 Tax=Paenarthrobacter sp. CM16 TaxID=2738447 RepID=UPI00155316DC|nr:crotonase/enoyl-CoA hydratase family protein [Paenarthrobacter sp. CM16]NQD88105.1 crotonase/enoyl-CoA hydratase family protein [Paenarthrobacter sp. CM16]